MERKIGEIFEFGGEWYQCVKGNTCDECSFNKSSWNCSFDGTPYCSDRSDEIEVIFKKLEKVGEPYRRWLSPFNNVMVQRYRLYGRNVIMPDEPIMLLEPNYKNSVEIEIKQIKEDMEDLDKIKVRDYTKVEELNVMEEKKLNLKPFDIQKAREGKPVCTRDGHKARIICFDRKDNTPIVALIECANHAEILQCVHNDGKCFHYDTSDNDLMMLPEKKEGWINVKKDAGLFKSREEAERNCTKDYATVRVEFEI